jgi:N utilization substance protein B
MTKRSRAREVALQLLFQHDFNAKIARADVVRFVADRLRDSLNAEFCLDLFDGVLAHLEDIDRRLGEAAENWRLPRMAAVDRNVLRLGAHEVLFIPDTPAGVALNEAIELARRFGSAESPAFVNGVLDRLLKSREPKEPGVRNQESGDRNQGTGVRNQESGVGDNESPNRDAAANDRPADLLSHSNSEPRLTPDP